MRLAHVFTCLLVAIVSGVHLRAHPEAWPVLGWALGAGVVFTGLAYALRFLDAGGAVTGGLLAVSVVGLGGWAWAVPSFTFFLTSSALSQVGRRRKAAAGALSEQGRRRDAGQVYANGGVGWALLLLYAVHPLPVFYWGFLGAFAAANADTWATEIGSMARGRPRLITTGRRVPAGTSGAVSGLGTVAALLGAAVVAASAVPVLGTLARGHLLGPIAGVVVGGSLGAFVDSLLGATVQARFLDPETGAETERAGANGVDFPHRRGWRWLRNDAVNGICTFAGGVGAMTCFRLAVVAFY